MPYKTSKLVLFFFTIVLLVDTVTVFVSADILGIDDDQGFGDDLGLSHFVTGTCFTMPDDVDGIGRKMYFYVDSNIEYAPHTIKCAIYTNISGTNQGTLLTNSQTNETVIYEFPGGDFGWADCKFNDTHMPLLEEGTTYYLTIWTNGTWTEGASMEILWDNNVSNGSGTVEFTDLTYVAGDYSGFPSTFNQTALLPAYNGRIVIYCEYDNFGDPANVDATLYGNANLNISWTANASADKTLVVRKRGSFPSSPTDAAATVIHNSTINYYNDTNIEYDYWYRLYSYNSSVNAYSDGVNLNFGGIVVNCYNESNASENLTFDVYITNEDGSDTYVDTGCDN